MTVNQSLNFDIMICVLREVIFGDNLAVTKKNKKQQQKKAKTHKTDKI